MRIKHDQITGDCFRIFLAANGMWQVRARVTSSRVSGAQVGRAIAIIGVRSERVGDDTGARATSHQQKPELISKKQQQNSRQPSPHV